MGWCIIPGVMNRLGLLTMNDDHFQPPIAWRWNKIIVADCTLLEGAITTGIL